MGKMQRDKGKAGEREIVALLQDVHNAVGFAVRDRNGAVVPLGRNHAQAERGGHDVVGVAHYAPEVKRVAKPPSPGQVGHWWTQAVNQAEVACKAPLLLYRANQRAWTACLWAQLPRGKGWFMVTLTEADFLEHYKQVCLFELGRA